MYSKLQVLTCAVTISTFIYGIIKKEKKLYGPSLLTFILYPVVFEFVQNFIAQMFRYTLKNHKCSNIIVTLPIVYHKNYNITAWGLENLHPFDSTKYKRIYELLQQQKIITSSDKIHTPALPSSQFLREIMSFSYLQKLNYSINISVYLELPLFLLPASVLRWRVLDPMMLATQGSVDAACLALQYNWAINLGGGYHHANKEYGGGFCIYPDITFIVHYIRQWHQIQNIMIIDLDAHQGNGYERDLINNQNVYIIDAFNQYIYPNDKYAMKRINLNISITFKDNDQTYLDKVKNALEQGFKKFQPQFVIYNAGTDIMINDPLGGLNITEDGIIKRDEIVFEQCYVKKKVPIVMLLSGGYQKSNAPAIAKSIQNLFEKFKFRESQTIQSNLSNLQKL